MECSKAKECDITNFVYCETLKSKVNQAVVCTACKKYWVDNNPPETREDNKYLMTLGGPLKTIVDAAKTVGTWVKEGMPLTSEEELKKRKEICGACEHWTGSSCKVCHCSGIKLSLATAKCPLEKW